MDLSFGCTRIVVSDIVLIVDAVHLIQSVANNGQYGNARVQPIMIKKLAGMSVVILSLSLSLSLNNTLIN